MSQQALKVLESASRRELQALAKELQLCRGNAKSDVIVNHAVQFLEAHPKDGEQRLLGVLGGGSAASTPSASPVTKKQEKKEEDKTVVVTVDTSAKQIKSGKQQPEDEPVVTIQRVEVVQTNAKVAVEKKTTPKKKNAEASKQETKVTPKGKKKSKQMPPPAVTATKAVPTAAVKSPKAAVKTSAPTTKSPSSKTQPSASGKKNLPAASKKPSPVGKKAEKKARKTLEELVKAVPDLTFSGDARVRCSTTGHEMKADVDVITTYIRGKRYQKARNLKLSFAKYAPMFVDHPDESKPDMLWCHVTESAIARDVKRVEAHIAAPKYRKDLPLWKEQEATKKKAEEEEAQRRATRIAAAKTRRLEAEQGGAESERPTKRKRTADARK